MLRESKYKYVIIDSATEKFFEKWENNNVLFTDNLDNATLFDNIPNSMKTRIQLATKDQGKMLQLKTGKFRKNEKGELI